MTGALANHLWQSTLFAVAAALLSIAFRKNRAKVRYWLWFSASVKFLVPFWLLIALGSHWQWRPAVRPVALEPASITVIRMSQPFAGPLPSTAPVDVSPDWVPVAVFAVWGCGFLTVLLLRLRLWLGIQAVVRASEPMEIAGPVAVRSSPGLLEPGVVGVWSPILLLPAGIEETLTAAQLEAVLAHELCHVRRRDNLRAVIHMVVEALFWFHPLVWWIGARLVEERERACDEDVLRLGSEPRIYADAIVRVCRLYVESPLAFVPGVTGAGLKRRIEAIMSNYTGERLNRWKTFLLVSAATAALAGPILIGGLIRLGNAPAIHAAPPAASTSAPAGQPTQDSAVQPPVAGRYEGRRLVAMLIDFTTMTGDEQAGVRQSALDFVQHKMKPEDLVAIMAVDHGQLRVINDFTDDHGVLESSIAKLSAADANNAAGSAPSVANIQAAAKLLESIPGKKSLLYFSGATRPVVYGQSELQEAIATAEKSNVALVPRYVPVSTFEGQPEITTPLVDALNRESRSSGEPVAAPPIAGLPGRHASFSVYAEHDRFAPAHRHAALVVPLDSFSGHVDVLGEVLSQSAGSDTAQNHVRDTVPASIGTFQADFMLDPGVYVCHLVVRDESTGRVYGETIRFEVN